MLPKSKVDYGDKIIIEKGHKFKYVTLKKGRKVSIDKLNFYLDNAVGCYYNTTFDVRSNHLHKLCYNEVSSFTSEPSIIEGVDNSTLADDPSSQKLSHNEIEDYKKSGLAGMDLVEKLVENSSTFDTKTEFSRVKYIKKKLKKHSNRVVIRWPTARIICRNYWNLAPNKICHLRYDTLAQLLTMADIKAKSKVVIVESCQGLITTAVMERMGGLGVIIHLHAGDIPTIGYSVTNCNFSQVQMDTVLYLSLREINNLESENAADLLTDPNLEQMVETTKDSLASPGDDCDVSSKQFSFNKNQRIRMKVEAKKYLLAQNLDGLIIVTKFDPLPVLKSLIKYIAPSRSFIVYCFLKEPLAECYTYLQERQLAINIQLTETWLREYQVLSNRTHPLTMMSGSGGYLLSGIKIDSGYDHKDVKNNNSTKDDESIDNERMTDVNIVDDPCAINNNFVDEHALSIKRELAEGDRTETETKKRKGNSDN